jgi:hypothetical protein
MAGALKGILARNKGKAALAAGGAGTVGYLATRPDEQPQDPTLGSLPLQAGYAGPSPVPTQEESSSTSTTTQTTSKGYTPQPIQAPKLSALEELQILEPRDLEARNKELAAARRTPEQKALFGQQLKLLDKEIKAINKTYETRRAEVQTKAEAETERAKWAQLAEGLANAAITIAAAQQGLARNQNIVGNVTLTRTDWQNEIDRILKRAQADRSLYMEEEKSKLGEIDKLRGVAERQEERDFRSEEAAVNDVRQEQAGEARDIRQENLLRPRVNAKEKADREEAQARLNMEAAQANERAQQAAASSTTTSTTERQGTKEGTASQQAQQAAAQQAAKLKAFGDLTGAIEALKKSGGDTPTNRKQAADAATLVGIPPSELETLIKESTGAGMFNLAEPKKVQDILNKYDPRAAQQQAASGGAQPPVANLVNVRQKSTGRVVAVDPEKAAKILENPAYEKAD